jgi:hypothetical protein
MSQWEYCKVDLNLIPRRATDVDVLNQLGNEGWELVNMPPNNMAYFKRQRDAPASAKIVRRPKTIMRRLDRSSAHGSFTPIKYARHTFLSASSLRRDPCCSSSGRRP